MSRNEGEFDAFRGDIDAAERRIAREIEPGARALVVAVLVFVLIGSFVLPHTGDVRGWDVLFSTHGAGKAAIALPSRVFTWLALVFGVGFSMLALLTRRWALAWIAMAGSAVAWVGEFLGLADPVEGAVALAASVNDSAGLMFVPGMVGLGAPYWDSKARGVVANLERSHKAAHLARAAVDSIAFQVGDVLFAMEAASGIVVPELRVDGGATRNDTLMQFQADVIHKPVLRSHSELLSALGAAWLGGLTLGWWASIDEIETLSHVGDRFEPAMTTACAAARYEDWKVAVAKARLREPVGAAA